MPLLNARNSSSSKGKKALLKVAYSNNKSNTFGVSKKSFNVRDFLKVMVAISATLACFFGALAAYYHPYVKRLTRRKKSLNATDIGINFREFTFDELHEATDGFSRIIGKGSSGKVYRGTLIIDDAEIGIAVKKLEKKIEKSENEFMTELKIIGLQKLMFSALVLCYLRLFVVGDMLSHIKIMMRMKEEVKMMIWFLLIWF
jgi:hypothetical protein